MHVCQGRMWLHVCTGVHGHVHRHNHKRAHQQMCSHTCRRTNTRRLAITEVCTRRLPRESGWWGRVKKVPGCPGNTSWDLTRPHYRSSAGGWQRVEGLLATLAPHKGSWWLRDSPDSLCTGGDKERASSWLGDRAGDTALDWGVCGDPHTMGLWDVGGGHRVGLASWPV